LLKGGQRVAPPVDINYLAVLVSAVLYMIIGFSWYSKSLFGALWMELIGLTEKDLEKAKEKGMAKKFLLAFAAALIMAYTLAHFVDYTQSKTFMDGALTGFWIWLGFVATVLLSSILWENKPVKLYLINASYYLVSLGLMGGILAIWV
jgi:hypothetical protein